MPDKCHFFARGGAATAGKCTRVPGGRQAHRYGGQGDLILN